jgi:hypothetical protein
MCDYSLEAYRSRPAFEGEQYVTSRFTSGSIGFIAPGDQMTAICMAYDMRLKLENIPQSLQSALGVKDTETVTFARLDGELFQDGVRFANGAQVTLQRLGPGVKAAVEDALKAPRRERKTEFAT